MVYICDDDVWLTILELSDNDGVAYGFFFNVISRW